MTGFYSLAAPYDKLISPSAQYRCEGVKSLASALSDGQDPLNKVYLANGDSKPNYERDLANQVSLVTISADNGALIVFPATAMLTVPLANGVVYHNTVLAVPLGALPANQDLTLLQNEVLELVDAKFGVRGATYVTTVGAPAILKRAQHEAVQLAREARITDSESLIAKNVRLEAELVQTRAKITQLEAYITANA
jgi:hypothetical protein